MNPERSVRLSSIGPEVLEIYDGFPFQNEEEKTDIDRIMEPLERYFIGETNQTYGSMLEAKSIKKKKTVIVKYGTRTRHVNCVKDFGY